MPIPPVDRSPIPWRPQSADLYSTGASGAVPVRPVNATNAVESTDRIGEGRVVRDPEKPSVVDQENRDWTLAERKSTRLNSSHLVISYAVFCLKKKKK